MNDKFTRILLALLTIAFGGWSVAVWRAVDKIDTVVATQAIMVERIKGLQEDHDEHLEKPWHSPAGEAIIRLQEQQLRRRQ